MVWCKGGSRYVEGYGDKFLGFLVSVFSFVHWFIGFLVSELLSFLVYRFLGFLVSELIGFKVSWFQSFKVSMVPYYQNAISFFLEDIDPISKICNN